MERDIRAAACEWEEGERGEVDVEFRGAEASGRRMMQKGV